MNDVPCGRCGWELRLPTLDEACLDERGASHVVCWRCGAENAFAGQTPPPQVHRSKNLRAVPVALLMWLVIFGMLLLMLPAQQHIPSPPPEPPQYMTV